MADTPETTPEPLELDEATLASLEIPELEAEAPELPESEPEQPDTTPEPEPEPVRESREQQLARELAEQRQLNARLAADLTQRSQPPPQPQHGAEPWAHLPEADRQTWERGAPILRQMFGQMLAPLVPVIQKANEANERLALRNARFPAEHPMAGQIKYPDFAEYEEVASQYRWQHYQQTGRLEPLELAYLVAKGTGMTHLPQPVQQAKARTATKRQQAARTAAAGSVTPHQGSAPASRLTPERIAAMSDEQFRKEILGRTDIPKLDVQDRRRRA